MLIYFKDLWISAISEDFSVEFSILSYATEYYIHYTF